MSSTHIVLVIFVYLQHSIVHSQNFIKLKFKRKKHSITMEFMSNDWMTAKHSTGVSIIEIIVSTFQRFIATKFRMTFNNCVNYFHG